MSTIDKIIYLLDVTGKTQKDLTDYLGVDKSTFSAWKSKKSKSYQKYLKDIAKYLAVPISSLLEEDSEHLPNEYLILNRKMKKMTPEQLKQLIDIADIIFKEKFND